MNPYLWEESKQENISKKDVGSCNKSKERICAKKGKDISIVKRRERGGM